MDLGWTKSWRKRWESDLATYPNANHLFQYLIDSASYKERDASFRYQCVHLMPGDVLIGSKSAAAKTGLTRQTIRTCLEYLKSTNRVTIRSTKRFSIVSIIKWDTYQGDDTAVNQDDNHQTNQQVTINQPSSNHIQEVKKVKKVKKDQNPTAAQIAADKIVSYYEKEVRDDQPSRFRARKNVLGLLKKGFSKEVLWECVNLYANGADATDPQFRKVAGNFFGRDSVYMSYIDQAKLNVEATDETKG